jgi:EAL domain-containing protein (putative c-di-GMP-specific phosphodiesterase class I)/DNA-binding response OmpR family regulator
VDRLSVPEEASSGPAPWAGRDLRAEPEPSTPVRVLVVDDEDVMRRSFAAVLTHAGFEVLTAADGHAALAIARRERPDVVLLDRHLPDINGQEVLDDLRADHRTDGAVILMISGDGQLENKLEGLGGGANDYLTKPIDLRELLARIDGHLTARDRWISRLDRSMETRSRVARQLVSVDVGRSLAETVPAISHVLDAELGLGELALSTRRGKSLASPIDGHGRQGATTIAASAATALLSPWLERAPGRTVVHLPLQTASGTFAVLSAAPTGEPEPVLSALVDLAPQLAAMLLPGVDRALTSAEDREHIGRLMEPDGSWPVFQPIVALPSGTVVGYEGLTRFVDGTAPDLAFALAGRLGLGVEFELEAARRTLVAAEQLPPSSWLSLNVSADTLLNADLRPLVEGIPRRLVLEITEHELVTDYAAVIAAVDQLPNVGLSVDDAGSGYASLRHVYELRPAMVKLDRAWVADIDRDPVRQALIGGLKQFAAATGAELVGEGIERQDEADVLSDLGVPLGQGYHFGRPAPAVATPAS